MQGGPWCAMRLTKQGAKHCPPALLSGSLLPWLLVSLLPGFVRCPLFWMLPSPECFVLPSMKNSTLSQSPVHWGSRKPWLKAVGKSPLALSALKTMLSVWKGTKTTEKLSRTYCLCVRFCHCSHISFSSQPQLCAGSQMHAEGTFPLASSGTAGMEVPFQVQNQSPDNSKRGMSVISLYLSSK